MKEYQLVLIEEFIWRYYFRLSNTITIKILDRINIKKYQICKKKLIMLEKTKKIKRKKKRKSSWKGNIKKDGKKRNKEKNKRYYNLSLSIRAKMNSIEFLSTIYLPYIC